MKPYCVIVVKYVLPAIRVLIMNILIEKYDFRKIDVAEKLSLTPAAVTQYSKGIRGSHLVNVLSSSEEIMNKVYEISEDIAEDTADVEDIMCNICEICKLIRSNKLICNLHEEEFSDSALDECTICLETGL